MGIFKILLKYLAPKLYYSSMPDEELKEERESIRQQHLSGNSPSLGEILHLIDSIQLERMNEKFRQENPDAKTRHKEHGWYLPEDDD